MSRFSISSDSICSTVDLEAPELAFPSSIHPKSEKQEVWPGPMVPEKDHAKHHRHFSIQLPPPDRGYQAWGYLLGAFIVEALCWGAPTDSPLSLKLTTYRFPTFFWSFPELSEFTSPISRKQCHNYNWSALWWTRIPWNPFLHENSCPFSRIPHSHDVPWSDHVWSCLHRREFCDRGKSCSFPSGSLLRTGRFGTSSSRKALSTAQAQALCMFRH
jgi:hypothetical protein